MIYFVADARVFELKPLARMHARSNVIENTRSKMTRPQISIVYSVHRIYIIIMDNYCIADNYCVHHEDLSDIPSRLLKYNLSFSSFPNLLSSST